MAHITYLLIHYGFLQMDPLPHKKDCSCSFFTKKVCDH
uniref:Uncharacterized protein n=1 Tax=Oryza sativa subsp. japonica TaxID=39947 RepID=Q2QLQ6_ORYSJ|nr:hypothetical protein LOC_Os12g43649 [Oryza sativa Japonica Group]